ncbi:hypothetical protein Nepgr_032134 [Nepenthes gracilis]|uniref:Uncharacterized protein n=1 Tax=Nepenthes gracilis TaxID=150966 RepID=A0AAD3TJR8_NEPGR|nr:hypothetical protein Nepgr_032134 [Nepenthes gracilis]
MEAYPCAITLSICSAPCPHNTSRTVRLTAALIISFKASCQYETHTSRPTYSKDKELLQHINQPLLYTSQQLQQNRTGTDQIESVFLHQFACYSYQPYFS